jgi:histidinol-phosphate aminotransferase
MPLDAATQVLVSDYRRACGAIILPNPNAPTGIAPGLEDIETLLVDHPEQVVVIDEADVDFGGQSAVPLVSRYSNLLVIQTFSISRGLAGLRVGFAIGQRALIEGLERVKDSFNSNPLDRLAMAGAVAAFEGQVWFEEQRHRIIATRETLSSSPHKIGFEVLPSSANFLFTRHPAVSSLEIAARLRNKAILVRHFPKARIHNYLRISIGTDTQCKKLPSALEEVTAPALLSQTSNRSCGSP